MTERRFSADHSSQLAPSRWYERSSTPISSPVKDASISSRGLLRESGVGATQDSVRSARGREGIGVI
jgi:hypothetical protein